MELKQKVRKIRESEKVKFVKSGLDYRCSLKSDCFICLNESPLKMMENAFYFLLKALFVLKMALLER